ncbi:MAG: tetratricopeptide repeat protein [Treponema sp.]|jgi:tetratricopeptide (TPR) repeat protein|nr:tetratricopeptide repeat protein [Treponema sp.]
MPSLQALKEFKSSFDDIGREKADRGEEFDDFPLPDTEAAGPGPEPAGRPGGVPGAGPGVSAAAGAAGEDGSAGEFFAPDTGAAGDLNFDDVDLATGAALPGEDTGTGGDLDFGDFLDTIPDDLPLPEIPGLDTAPGPETAPAEEASGFDMGSLDESFDLGGEDSGGLDLGDEEGGVPAGDFGLPDGLLDGLDADLEPAPADAAGEAGAGLDLGGDAGAGLDLGGDAGAGFDLGGDAGAGFDLGGEEGGGFDLGGEADAGFDLGGDAGVGFDLGGEEGGGLDLGGDADVGFDLGGEAAPETESAMDFSVPDLDGVEAAEAISGDDLSADLGEVPDQAEDMDFSVPDIGGFDLGGEETAAPSGDSGGDTFDSFNLDDGAGFGDAAGPGADSLDELEDFSLAGFDDAFTGAPAAGTATAQGRGESFAASEDVEEIQLSDGELLQLQKTISGYPLNLRIACEELIAEQAVAPDLMSSLIKLLVKGASAKETAALAGKALGRTIAIPRGFEKKTGSELEAEQASFAYIFVHNFLPVLRLFLMIAIAVVSLGYLIYRFVYTPLRAESIYKRGYERLQAGEYERANERFDEAFRIHRVKNWFFRYAEGFRDLRMYQYAEEKYDELLRFYPRDKKGVLDYAALETYYIRNYAKAESLLQRNILDYNPNDREGLLALGDNALAWGDSDKSKYYEKYEDARFAYARLLDLYGWKDPIVERMLKYFIRTDNLKEVLPLQAWFMDYPRRQIGADTLAELGGYLLDKKLEEVRGVPNEYVARIEGIREVLLKAVKTDPGLPESHYHLSRYYRSLDSNHEEKVTLERAIAAFDGAGEGTVRRIDYRIRAHRRYGNILAGERRFIPAEEQIIKGIGIYEDALARRLLSPAPEYGRLYADLGDLEYFTQDGNMEAVIQHYLQAERNGWASPELHYRLGSAYYHLADWAPAMERFFTASANLPLNRRLLYALGNAAYLRGNYFAAQGYYNRLLDILEAQRARLPLLLPNDRPDYIEVAERLMIARNNMGVTLEALTERTGDNRYRTRALAFYAESSRAWDALTRNPDTMIRSGSTNLAFLNSRNSLYPERGYEPQIFRQIDKDVLEPSIWERLAPPGSRLAGGGDAGAAADEFTGD